VSDSGAAGGPDPNMNSKLAVAIANAKKSQLSKTSIESAIAKGQGKSLSGAPLENLTVEAMLPYGVAAMIEYQTESKAKVLQDIRALINKKGGNITPTSFLFEKKGKIWFQEQESVGVDEAMDEAIEAGATDITIEDGKLVVETEPTNATVVSQRLQDRLKLHAERSEIVFDPKEESMIELTDEQTSELSSLLDMIEDEPSLQNIYLNAAM
jgi:transcriptional/translational regulatory protein YebC/TACO1